MENDPLVKEPVFLEVCTVISTPTIFLLEFSHFTNLDLPGGKGGFPTQQFFFGGSLSEAITWARGVHPEFLEEYGLIDVPLMFASFFISACTGICLATYIHLKYGNMIHKDVWYMSFLLLLFIAGTTNHVYIYITKTHWMSIFFVKFPPGFIRCRGAIPKRSPVFAMKARRKVRPSDVSKSFFWDPTIGQVFDVFVFLFQTRINHFQIHPP